MVALVDDKSVLRDILRVDLIRVEEEDELRLSRRGLLRGDEPDVVRGRPGGNLDT